MLITSLLVGSIVHFRNKRKMRGLKEEAKAMRLSLEGMWDNNANWDKKYSALKMDYQALLQKKELPNSAIIKQFELPKLLIEEQQRFEA